MDFILYRTLKFLLRPFFIFNHRVKYIGVENIPEDGPVILAGNHTSNYDALLMLGGPKRIVHMLSKKELFVSGFTKWFFRNMACIPVDRSIHDENAKSEVVEVLKSGEMIGIFPEGTRNKEFCKNNKAKLLPFKYGAVSFAKKTGALIVPFSITGSYNPFKGGIRLTYGKAYKVTGDLDSENDKLKSKVEKLIKENI